LNLFAYPFLADENIHPDVIAQMKSQGLGVWSVNEVAPPFIIVALRQQNEVRIRVRQM